MICASAGNHAQGVALSAERLGCRSVIVMPVTTPKLKIDAVRSYQGEVVLHGDSYSDAYLHALELSKFHNYTFVHPFDDPDVIAGQGTVGMEILRQHQHPIHADLRRDRRRRADFRGGRIREGRAARDQSHRGANGRL